MEKILKWTTFTLLIVLVVGCSLLAFHEDARGTDYPISVSVSWTNDANRMVCSDADSVLFGLFFGDNDSAWSVSPLADTVAHCSWVWDTTVTTPGWWHVYVYLFVADTIKVTGSQEVYAGLNALDTLLAHAPHADNWGGTAAGGGGTGPCDVTFTVVDTSGTDTPVPNASVTVQNSTQTATVAYGLWTDALGQVVYKLDNSTAYKVLAYCNNYVFDTFDTTIGSGSTFAATVRGYNLYVTGSPASAQRAIVYGYVYTSSGDSLEGVMVSVTPSYNKAPYTSTQVVIPRVEYAWSNASGYWQIELWGVDSTTNLNSYTFKFKHSSIGAPAGELEYREVKVPASATLTNFKDLIQ